MGPKDAFHAGDDIVLVRAAVMFEDRVNATTPMTFKRGDIFHIDSFAQKSTMVNLAFHHHAALYPFYFKATVDFVIAFFDLLRTTPVTKPKLTLKEMCGDDL